MKAEKEIIRESKELGLYAQFRKLTYELKKRGLYHEFMNIVCNEHTGGLKSFINIEKRLLPFDHVVDWMTLDERFKVIYYDGETMPYSTFIELSTK